MNNTPNVRIDNNIYIPAHPDTDKLNHNFWAKVFDIHYEKISDQESATSDISVWKNSYDGAVFSKEEMEDWIANAIHKVKKLLTPKTKVLEIGCGNGLIFASIIHNVASYTGVDISKSALKSIAESKLGKDFKDKIKLYHLPASSINTITEKHDLIVINSVAQYFPDINYFFDFIEKCESILSPTGTLFFGDIRSYDMADQFYEDIARFKFPDDQAKATAFALRTKNKDNETLYSTSLFHNLPRVFSWIKSVAVSSKISNYSNEMSRFRYDVLITSTGENSIFPHFSLSEASNHISKTIKMEVIENRACQIVSLHPKLFRLAQLNETK